MSESIGNPCPKMNCNRNYMFCGGADFSNIGLNVATYSEDCQFFGNPVGASVHLI